MLARLDKNHVGISTGVGPLIAYHEPDNSLSCLGCVTDWQQETRGLFLLAVYSGRWQIVKSGRLFMGGCVLCCCSHELQSRAELQCWSILHSLCTRFSASSFRAVLPWPECLFC